jgi:hypothetical protein
MPLRLKEADAQGFNRLFAVMVLKYISKSRMLLHALFIYIYIYIHAAKHEWEPLKLLAFHKFQNTLENFTLTATFINELVLMFYFISKQEPEAVNNLALYITDYLMVNMGPLQKNSSFWDFTE